MIHEKISAAMFSVEAEQQVLGAVLGVNERFHDVSGFLKPDHFWDPVHALIWKNIAARVSKDHMVSPITVANDLIQSDGFQALGGGTYLLKTVANCVSGSQVAEYAKMLVELHGRRQLAGRLDQISDEVKSGRQADDAAAELELLLHEREENSDEPRTMSFLKAQKRAIEQMQEVQDGGALGIPTGMRALDEVVSLNPKRYTLLGGATSMGKAQPLTSSVLCLDGWKRMGEMAVGDKIASVDGAPSEVVGVFPQGEKQIYRVTFSDGRQVRCCGEHLWQTYGPTRTQARVMSTDEIASSLKMKSYQGRLKVPLFEGDFGNPQDLPIDPWLLGVFLGDGSMHGGNPVFSIAEASLLWKIMEKIEPAHELVLDRGYDYRVRAQEGHANELTLALRELGYRKCRAEEKFIPEAYLNSTSEVRAAILTGLLDTDGWVERFGAVRFSTSSPVLADQVRQLVWSLGGVCSISQKTPKFTYKGETKTGQQHYILNIRHPSAANFFTVLKKSRRCTRTKPVRLTIKSIEKDGIELAQCIAVSHPSKLYVTDGFVMTHNTGLALSIALAAARSGYGVGFVTLEMPEEDLANRINSSVSTVPYKAYDRKMSENTWRQVIGAAKELQGLPIEIFSDRVRDVPAILSEGKKLKRKMVPNGNFKGFKLLVIDYIQLVRGRGESAHVRLAQVANDLKQVAKQLDVHVLALAQIDRSIGAREDTRPALRDLRGSGDLENAPDNVLFVHRPEYYLTRQTPPKKDDERADWEADLAHWKDKAEIIVGKARMGEIGSVQVACDMGTNRFFDVPDQQQGMDF